MPAADADQIELAARVARGLGARVVEVGQLIQGSWVESSQHEHQIRDWLEIVAASQVGRTIDILWFRANGGSL
jgi:hypothetical protein